MKHSQPVAFRRLFIVLAAGLVVLTATLLVLAAAQIDLIGPPGSESFGGQVIVLANGNIVVADPGYDAPGPITDTGAVYLYNGATGALMSWLTGSQVDDQVGIDIVVLSNGNYVVLSPNWDNGATTDAGAVTWENGATGITGVVSITNSLVGSMADDQVGAYGLEVLSNGNYVVQSPLWDNGADVNVGAATWGNGTTGITGTVSITNSLVGRRDNDMIGSGIATLDNGNYVVLSIQWDNGAALDAGAATWGNGATGITGVVSSANSLVGSRANDSIGYGSEALSNGNYVIYSSFWDNGTVTNAGAATWGNGATGITGVVSITNSLVGSRVNDQVSSLGVRALSNGNYVASSSNWDNGAATDAGAVTWGNGTLGTTGAVTITNSLVGGKINDRVGNSGIWELSNGNYVVPSSSWDKGAVTDVGAVTWGNGTTGITGVVSTTNSLVGSTANDRVGIGVWPLSNGNYVVRSSHWINGAAVNAGAVTWGNGATGITGVVSITNSLVGSTANDQIGDSILVLSNGNYVVRSPNWDDGAIADVGAATWGNGATGITGVVSITNSLVGSSVSDRIGDGIAALSNGNYVVYSPQWNNGAVSNAGAATWGNGATGVTGVVSITNSLVGSRANDQVGDDIVTLNNGNYVVQSPYWRNNAAANAGAATWGNGATGTTGIVSITNSLLGSTADDLVGDSILALNNGHYVVLSRDWNSGVVTDTGAVTWGDGALGIAGVVSITNSLVGSTANDQICDVIVSLSNGHYVVLSPNWDNGATTDSGAVTWGDGHGGTVGPITADNSVRGSAAGGGPLMNFDYDYTHNQLIVGRRADNIVTLFRPVYQVYLPLVRK